MQDPFFALCQRAFKSSEATTYPEYVALAKEKVAEFLNLEGVRVLDVV